jgi:hypothetical protein
MNITREGLCANKLLYDLASIFKFVYVYYNNDKDIHKIRFY